MLKKQFKWNFYVFVSAFDLLLGGTCFFFAFWFYAKKTTYSFAKNNFTNTLDFLSLYKYITCPILIFVGILCFGLAPYLTKKRQEARDEAEYDEDGISYKKGNFSALSKQERDAIERQLMVDRERILPSSLLKSITKTGPADADKELNELIALDNVKAEVLKMRARMEFERSNAKKNNKETLNDGMNMIFIGSPGTGKTTVARILTTYFFKYGYVKKNKFIEIDGNFFNGLSVGESSKRASALIKASKDGVLFIDEAYSLLSSGGQEVIATIIKAMEDYRKDIIFIFAGYDNEIKKLVLSNPGFESRIKYTFKFNDYNEKELKEIVNLMANKKNFYVPYDVLEKIVDILNIQKKKNANFGNARDVRTLLDKIIDNHAYNLKLNILSEDYRYTIMACDLQGLKENL